tara:strand:- start:230 stop:454 length:225 start_codon:yes stop_codon:yes gene_type:complete
MTDSTIINLIDNCPSLTVAELEVLTSHQLIEIDGVDCTWCHDEKVIEDLGFESIEEAVSMAIFAMYEQVTGETK